MQLQKLQVAINTKHFTASEVTTEGGIEMRLLLLLLLILKYPDDFARAQGLNQLWRKDTAVAAVAADNAGFNVRHTYIVQLPTTKGTFSFRVPLKHIFVSIRINKNVLAK